MILPDYSRLLFFHGSFGAVRGLFRREFTLCGSFLFVLMGSPAEGYQTAALADAHDAYAAGIPALGGDLRHRDPDNDAVIADEDYIVLFLHGQNARYRPVLLGVIVLDTLAAASNL